MFTGNTVGGFLAGQIAKQILPLWGWPGIFLIGGIVPLVLLGVALFALPESPQFQEGARPESADANPVGGLFEDGLAVSTLLIWVIFLINLLNLYLVNYWLPTVLNLGGFKPEEAAFVSSMFSAGGALCTLVLAPAISRFGAAPTLAVCLAFGAVCLGLTALHMSYLGIILVLMGGGAGIIGSQLGLNGYVASLYPAGVRTTGIGWALGIGRLGGIAGPVVGGALLGFGLPPDKVMLFACGPGLVTALLVVVLGAQRRG